jgi:hypothetical protein
MSKRIHCILFLWLLLGGDTGASAQNFNEWFRQKKTQRKYLVQQIAALQVYLGYLQKGYQIAGEGLSTLRQIKNGDWDLHRDFLGSFERVNPRLRAWIQPDHLRAIHAGMRAEFSRFQEQCQSDPAFTPAEKRYLHGVYRQLTEQSDQCLQTLRSLTTEGELELKEDERLERLASLLETTREMITFSRAFRQETRLLAAQRKWERAELAGSVSIHSQP